MTSMNNLYPVFLKLEHRRVLVVGGGKVALQKISGLLDAGADTTVVAPVLAEAITSMAASGKLRVFNRDYHGDEVHGYFLVIAATDDRSVQKRVFEDARKWNVPVNIVDEPEMCDFYLGAVFQEGELKIAVSTNGKSPTLGKIIRDKIREEYSKSYPDVLDRLGKIREDVRSAYPDSESRKRFHEQIMKSELERVRRNMEQGRRDTPACRNDALWRAGTEHGERKEDAPCSRKGKVYLIGAGPGDPELITLKGIRILRTANVVVYDALVSDELLFEVPQSVEKIYVGKRAGKHCMKQSEINAILLEKAQEGKTVVRLKGGDPFVFGRGGEEMEFLNDAGIEVEVVPGVTSGIGVPTSLGIPLTYRNVASSVAFVTGHEDPEKDCKSINWEGIASADSIVIYMGVRRVACIVERLIGAGVTPEKPVAVIFGGTLPTAQVITGKLSEISDQVAEAGGNLPGLIVVGDVVSKFSWSLSNYRYCEHDYVLRESF